MGRSQYVISEWRCDRSSALTIIARTRKLSQFRISFQLGFVLCFWLNFSYTFDVYGYVYGYVYGLAHCLLLLGFSLARARV